MGRMPMPRQPSILHRGLSPLRSLTCLIRTIHRDERPWWSRCRRGDSGNARSCRISALNDERAFRIAFWALLGAVVLMRCYFAFRVHRAGERLLPASAGLAALDRRGVGCRRPGPLGLDPRGARIAVVGPVAASPGTHPDDNRSLRTAHRDPG
jgi:hypothetical protein